jgi:hypothetical protein
MVKVKIGGQFIHQSTIADGQRIYYDFIISHSAFDGKIPGQKCGIKIEGNDKWMTIFQNAKQELKNER